MSDTYTITLREPTGRIQWALEVVPDYDDSGKYYEARRVTVIDCITFAGDTGVIGEPDSKKQSRDQGTWLYREYEEEIDCLMRAAIERNKERAA